VASTVTTGAFVANETITGSLSAGAFSYGTLSYSDVDITMSTSQSVNSYSQQIQQNTSNGTAASADYIVSNNNGTATTYYGDFGITSSGFNTPGQNIVNTPSTVYLQSVSTDLAMGTLTSGKNVHIIAGGSATDAITVNGTNNAVAFNGSYGTSGQVLTSGGTGAAPTWTTVSGGGISWQSVQTTGFTASTGNGYPVNTNSGSITVTLPASPSAGNSVTFTDYAGTFGTNNLVISPNGNKINGSGLNAVISTNRESVSLVYIDSTQGWVIYSGFNASNPTQSVSISYLIAAGGGGGGALGGGGAGGLLTGTSTLTGGTTYTVTIGSGGTGGNTANSPLHTNGGNSSIIGGAVSLTATGGGWGGNFGSPTAQSGNAGGSGGGGGGTDTGGTAGSGGAGTSGQGNAGAAGTVINTVSTGGGGGGAGAAGAVGTNGAHGGQGGIGVQSSITGSAVYYSGGGSGGGSLSTTGGSGGGGTGGAASSNGGAGTANTGGGGGGGGNTSPDTGGNGGSGVVIISVPTSAYSGTTTGSPTVTTSGSNTIIKFTASGSYTA
jgi:hypothetical protein